MKRIICYLRTIKEFNVFLMALFNFGALYIAHDYKEGTTKFNKRKKRIEETLICQTCGDKSIAWRKLK
jgi:hypothetical protein